MVVGIKGFLTPPLNHQSMSRVDLERVREWANAKLFGGQQCQRAEHPYMKLSETVDAILAKMDRKHADDTGQGAREQALPYFRPFQFFDHTG
jgi:hypothetical protein